MRTSEHATDTELFDYSMSAELFSSKGKHRGVSRLATNALRVPRKPSVLRSKSCPRSSLSAPILKWMN